MAPVRHLSHVDNVNFTKPKLAADERLVSKPSPGSNAETVISGLQLALRGT